MISIDQALLLRWLNLKAEEVADPGFWVTSPDYGPPVLSFVATRVPARLQDRRGVLVASHPTADGLLKIRAEITRDEVDEYDALRREWLARPAGQWP